MDGKKQTNLTPELKEIYDRVMNTSANSKPATATQPPIPPPTPINTPTTTPPLHATPPPSPASSGLSMPSIPDAADSALTSSPPRPMSSVDGTKPFSFSGTAHTADSNSTDKKKGISLPLLIVLGVAFVAVWAVFWLVILGFINR